jgi:23S rRNA (guanosine2251-2'-O)-methyltransferase
MANDQLIYGLRPILQAVQDNQTIEKVFLQKGLSGSLYAQLEGTLRDAGIEPKYVPIEKLDRVTRGNHQGAVAYLSPIDFFDLEEIVVAAQEQGRIPLILALDRITDVRNFGAIARTRALTFNSHVIAKLACNYKGGPWAALVDLQL